MFARPPVGRKRCCVPSCAFIFSLRCLVCCADPKRYPSSKPTAPDWDSLEQQIRKEEEEERPEGDAALNKLLKGIYGRSDEDTRRAMMKSYYESGGTVLSTNWKDVGSRHVDGTPPEGLVMKKWYADVFFSLVRMWISGLMSFSQDLRYSPCFRRTDELHK